MPVTPTYPGVYIEEIPSGVHPITGVATSIAAFIDFFPKGPLDTGIQVLSQAGFERTFGGLNANSEASYAIQQFFLNGGTKAYVVRVGDGSAIRSAAVVLLKSPAPIAAPIATVTTGTMVNGVSVHNPGAWGNNIRLDVDYDTRDPTQLFNLTAILMDPDTGQPVQTEPFRNLTFQPGASTYAPDVVNQTSQLIQLSAPPSGSFPTAATWTSAYRPAETGTVGTALPTPVGALPNDKDTFDVTVSADGTAANSSTYVAKISLGGATFSDYASVVPFLQAAIRAADQPSMPQLSALLAPLLSGAIVQLVGSGSTAHFRVVAGRGGANSPLASMTFADKTGTSTIADLKLAGATSNVQLYSLGITGTTSGAQAALTGTTGVGANGGLPGANQLIGIPANKTGLYALEDVDLFNILCIPRARQPRHGFAVVEFSGGHFRGERLLPQAPGVHGDRHPARSNQRSGHADLDGAEQHAARHQLRPSIFRAR